MISFANIQLGVAGPVLLDAGEKVDEVGRAGYLYLDREGLLGGRG